FQPLSGGGGLPEGTGVSERSSGGSALGPARRIRPFLHRRNDDDAAGSGFQTRWRETELAVGPLEAAARLADSRLRSSLHLALVGGARISGAGHDGGVRRPRARGRPERLGTAP